MTVEKAFEKWWGEQSRQGDPARNPHLAQQAFANGYAEGLAEVIHGFPTIEGENSSKPVEKYGWVIEGDWSTVSEPEYWMGSCLWTKEHMLAIRFARKQDAERIVSMMMHGINVRICEHGWI